MDTSFRPGNLLAIHAENALETLAIARPTLPHGAKLASRFAAEEKQRLFPVFTPVSGRLV